MTPVDLAVLVGSVVLAGVVALVIGLRRLRTACVAAAERRLGADRIILIDPAANSFGIESAGPAQLRGNGCLAVSDHEILFVMWLPRREVAIDWASVRHVTTARSHLGRTRLRDLLRVEFRNPAGDLDAVAWLVADLDAWLAVLGGLRER
jgi:hypothetical protein